MRLLQFYRCCFFNEHKLTSASCHQSQKNINQFHDLKQCHLLENAESKKLIYSLKEKKAEKDFTVKKKPFHFIIDVLNIVSQSYEMFMCLEKNKKIYKSEMYCDIYIYIYSILLDMKEHPSIANTSGLA